MSTVRLPARYEVYVPPFVGQQPWWTPSIPLPQGVTRVIGGGGQSDRFGFGMPASPAARITVARPPVGTENLVVQMWVAYDYPEPYVLQPGYGYSRTGNNAQLSTRLGQGVHDVQLPTSGGLGGQLLIMSVEAERADGAKLPGALGWLVTMAATTVCVPTAVLPPLGRTAVVRPGPTTLKAPARAPYAAPKFYGVSN